MNAEVLSVNSHPSPNGYAVRALLKLVLDQKPVNLSFSFEVKTEDDIPYRGDWLEVVEGEWGWELKQEGWMIGEEN